MGTSSFWYEDAGLETRPPLTADADCDLLVVGSGIAGLSTAYEAARFGWKVIVIDRAETIGGVMTPRTTAHLATELDDYYHRLIKARGEDDARTYYESQVAAVNRIEAICRDEGIDADFTRIDGYLVPAEPGHMRGLQDEFDACQRLGVEVEWADGPFPLKDGERALRFPNQGRFHPLKYVRGLIRAIETRQGRIYGSTTYVDHQESDDGVLIETEAGAKIKAKAAVFATNSPVNDKVAIHTKQIPDRTYVIAGPVPKGSVPDALVWDTLDAYHYVRLQQLSEAEDLLIVGGEDHRSGMANDMDERFAHLERWARDHYPSFREARYRWSGQVMEPVDFMPYSGRNPGNRNIYVHTGDSGQGMTNGVAGALNIAALLFDQKAHFADVLEPSRKPVSTTSLAEFFSGRAEDVVDFAGYLTPGEVDSVADIPPGEGALIRRGVHKIAAYRQDDGTVVERSAVCTHVGCLVHWNGLEKCWDCPCHGSQFRPDGSVINGPAIRPLARVNDEQKQSEGAKAESNLS
jgi:glycine/D-amino acid oxidase-like deaminating enzyme/nitrite reductase/ring-hydroxylating ferredoxin subunit